MLHEPLSPPMLPRSFSSHVASNYLLNHNMGLCANRNDTNQRNKGKITQVCQPQWQLVNSKSPSLTCMCGYWHKMHPTATTSVLVVLKISNAFKVHLILQSNIKLSKGSQNSKYPGNSQVFFITETASTNANAASTFFSFEIKFLEKKCIPRKKKEIR